MWWQLHCGAFNQGQVAVRLLTNLSSTSLPICGLICYQHGDMLNLCAELRPCLFTEISVTDVTWNIIL